MFENGDVLIQKFGGSSMASTDRIKKAAERIAAKAQRGNRMVVVVSAMGDTTDDLIELMNRVTPAPDRRELDAVMATGEMVSASLMASALVQLGVKACSFNAFNLGLISELQGDDYNITGIANRERLAEFLQPGCAAIVAGFQGITALGDLTTLGRGGSDLTAVIFARELGQKVCEKYTDEDGIYTADPRIVPDARKVWQLNYDEMHCLSLYGNGILHPRAISCARDNNIRIHVRSSFSRAEGSIVGPDGDDRIPVKSITGDDKFVYMFFDGVKEPDDAFYKAAGEFGPSVIQWQKSSDDKPSLLSFGFRRNQSFSAIPFCWQEAVRLEADQTRFMALLETVSLVGCGLNGNPQLVEKIVGLLPVKPEVVQHGGLRLSLAVEKDSQEEVMCFLHGLIKEGL